MLFPRLVFASIFIACCITTFAFGAATLPNDEVEALKSISKKLGKRNWNFDVDPCSREPSWFEIENSKYYDNNVTCDCSFSNNTICHVVNILLKSQNLSGILPAELVRLPFLKEIDLTRNYLSGEIPSQWGSMQLINILLGNRLTGLIPKELANISTLTSLVLEENRLSGTLPPELGNLTNIERMHLSSNNFSGELPETFARLTTLTEFRIDGNNFTGNIPYFIFQNWTKLEKLYIQASGLSGPIPAIVALQNLTDLRISDLNGAEASFPRLSNLPKLKRLILRSCNLTGPLPDSLGELTTVKILDVSFNRLRGGIPDTLSSLKDLDQLFLTGNMFTGPIPQWIPETNADMDLSYNNFTRRVQNCQQKRLNLFASTSRINNSGTVSCSESPQCPAEPLHFLYINCGGKAVEVNGNAYEADTNIAGPSTFVQSDANYWAISSTGVFLDDDSKDDLVIDLPNITQLSKNDRQLYTTARLSPNSLTYYAFCLKNGTYNVSLHFAEIQFTDDKSFSSLGRRMFDVYIQGKRELNDFNIKDEAGGVGKPILKNFTAFVTDGTVNIRLQWAGKGSTSIPRRGVYGPLISAISIFDPHYKPPSGNGGGISASVVVGIVAGATFATFLIMGILWWNGCLRQKSTLERDLKGIELQTSSFTLRQIKAATNNFDATNKIGEGGFGPVYKGILADGIEIAVKQLSAKSRQGNREFVTEIGMISALQHPHLVKLYGCCIEGNQLLLIYEYLENNSLARALFGPEEFQLKLDWPTRRNICIGIARGLAYLHEESRLKVVHRDIKATNVLLDKNLNPKISDFGLAKLDEEDNTHISTRIAGTYGYMAPEYAMHGHLSDKADVYSFGIVALEIVSGRCNTKDRWKEESFYLLDWAHILKEKGSLLDLVDPRIGSDFNIEEVMVMIDVALLCTNPTAAARPSMSSVVSVLEGRAAVGELITDSSVSTKELNPEAMKKFYQQIEENDEENGQTKSMLGDGPWAISSTSASDLYPVNFTSGYWQNRDSTN
ncbi:probable leucine-rich repeat receptor-like serine/threonine-protein kinase At3g14840 isoform X1 [Durio zibethinus]|uniref:non-specific serine/threonine protein kinase n=1 Tax=Durio zibethinus TaxID=66656 RepID=A0A6P5Y5P1_DURZI|nr:probable leucine-rich repeat receptor-like serine/threonine-protein kinase At3g14840 isoform X1 [Durio zibethinus]